MLTSSGKVSILVLFLILVRSFESFTTPFDVTCEFLVIAYIVLRKLPSIPSFPSVLITKEFRILSNAFCVSVKMTICFFPFSINVLCYKDGFFYTEPNCTPGINPTWSSCPHLLICCWFSSILSDLTGIYFETIIRK